MKRHHSDLGGGNFQQPAPEKQEQSRGECDLKSVTPVAPATLQCNMNRRFAPTIGRWISEEPIGFAGDGDNLRRYVGE
jgi:hypothetical protein